jgi:hypothetical protein
MTQTEFPDTVLLSPAYLAPVQYYTKFLCYEKILIEKEENYQKQSYRNRCNILSANGILPLTIPVIKDQPKTKTRDIRIDYSLDWQKNHWVSIESAYSSSPFFEFFQDEFYKFYDTQYKYLLDFDLKIQDYILDQLELAPTIELTEDFYAEPDESIDDYRDSIHPKPRMQKVDSLFRPEFYYQVFYEKYGFVKSLSIIDLLFNEGPNAENVLKKSLNPSFFNKNGSGK